MGGIGHGAVRLIGLVEEFDFPDGIESDQFIWMLGMNTIGTFIAESRWKSRKGIRLMENSSRYRVWKFSTKWFDATASVRQSAEFRYRSRPKSVSPRGRSTRFAQ